MINFFSNSTSEIKEVLNKSTSSSKEKSYMRTTLNHMYKSNNQEKNIG